MKRASGLGEARAQQSAAPPSEGGTVGTVDLVSPSSFVISLPSGQKATIATAASTSYRKGIDSASASAIAPGEPVLVLGIVADIQSEHKTAIKASQVIAQPPGITVTPPTAKGGFAPQRHMPAAKKDVGQIPADYVEGEGTIVGGTEANKAILAALAAYPNGLINRVVKLSDGSYEVHHIGVPWPHHIFVNPDFKWVGAN